MSYDSYPFIYNDRIETGMFPSAQPIFQQPAFPQYLVPPSGTPLAPLEIMQPAAPEMPVVPEASGMPAVPAMPMTPAIPIAPGTVMPGTAMPGAVMPGFVAPGVAMPGMMPVCPCMPFTGYGSGSYGMEDMGMGADIPDPRQPQPVLSNPPAITTISLFKELTGFPNYGNPSGNADILYTGTRGEWTFNVPAFLFVPGNLRRAQIAIRAVLDDHTAVPVDRYSARITINGTVVHTGRLPLEHGTPVGGRFNNWRLLTFDIPNFRRLNRVVIVNTSTTSANDWIAFDWMELRLFPR